jgi:hypothetical protein
MSDFQAIADRVEIEALRGEFTDAAMMRDRARLASLFTPDGALRMPNIPAEQDRAAPVAVAVSEDHRLGQESPGAELVSGDQVRGALGAQDVGCRHVLVRHRRLLQCGDLADHRVGALPLQGPDQGRSTEHVDPDGGRSRGG